MILRKANTGELEVYDIVNNQITSANSLGSVRLNWSVGGLATDRPNGFMGNPDDQLASNAQLVQAMAGVGSSAAEFVNPFCPVVGRLDQRPVLDFQHGTASAEGSGGFAGVVRGAA
jgi:hypothetical protein